MDARGRLPPAALCAFLQEAAGADAERRGAGMRGLVESGLAWVLQRLRVEIAAWPENGHEIAVTTWPTRFKGAMAERAFTVDSPSGVRLAHAMSRWAMVDLRTRRAARLPGAIRGLPVPSWPAPMDLGPVPAPPPAADPMGECRYVVGTADLDMVGHANNTRYVEWAFAAVPEEWRRDREAAAFDVSFRREALRGDTVLSRVMRGGPELLAHVLLHGASLEPLAVLESRWRRPLP